MASICFFYKINLVFRIMFDPHSGLRSKLFQFVTTEIVF